MDETLKDTIGAPLPFTGAELADMDVLRAAAPERAEAIERWRPTSTREAEWCMQELRAALECKAAIETDAQEMVDRVQSWLEWRMKGANVAGRIRRFEGLLVRYALDIRSDSGDKVKTVELPSGKIKTRHDKPRPFVADEAALVEWAESHEDARWQEQVVVRVPKVQLAELKKLVQIIELDDGSQVVATPEGELVEGVGVSEESFTAAVEPWSEPGG